MGGHRDELSLHERSLDVLVGLLKEEMVSLAIVVLFVCLSVYTGSWMKQFLLLDWKKPLTTLRCVMSVFLSACL